jgi:uncharacterized protein YbaA (DUF1428 family)
MSYVDGYLLPVPHANKEAYRKMAETAAQVFKDLGALSVMEAWSDDVPEGEVTSFSMAVKRNEDEAIVFSWVIWPDKATRDEGMKKFMSDPRLDMEKSQMPFDGKRMMWGGFAPIVEA